jgi:hypothetical protein
MGKEGHPVDSGDALPAAGPEDPVTDPVNVERRVWRNILLVIAAAVALTAIFADLRFALGLGLGGALALLNYRWLHSSVRAILEIGGEKAPPGASMKFFFRWLVIGVVVYLLTRTGLFDAVAILAGLFAPAAAIMMEAAYVTYKTLFHNGERR